jgi:hypothetical protein
MFLSLTRVLIPHLTEPMSNISAQNKRVISRFAALALISNKGGEGDGGEFHLFVGHFTELGNSDLLGVLGFLEIRLMSRLIPLKEAGVVYEVFDQVPLVVKDAVSSISSKEEIEEPRT